MISSKVNFFEENETIKYDKKDCKTDSFEEIIDGKLDINKKESRRKKTSLVSGASKKPSAYLVFCVLKNHSSENKRLLRKDIIDYIWNDYGVRIQSEDTITHAINEIGYINYNEFINGDYNETTFKNPKVIKAGNTGYFLVCNNNFKAEELQILFDVVKGSKLLVNSKTKKDLLTKICQLGEQNNYFSDLVHLKEELNKADESMDENSSIFDNKLNANLGVLIKAIENKKDIFFKYFKEEGVTFNITMTPLYFKIIKDHYFVVGTSYNIGFDYKAPESIDNPKFVYFVADFNKMGRVKIEDTTTLEPKKEYHNLLNKEKIYRGEVSEFFE